MAKVKIKSKGLDRAIKRFRRLPGQIGKDPVIDAALKRDAVSIQQTVIKGIRKSNLLKPPLKPATIRKKRQMGMPAPRTPLIGWGKAGSMVAGLQVRKLKGRWRVAPYGRHHSGLLQRKIWTYHGKGTGRIPARRPMRRGFERWLRSERKKETSDAIKKRITKLIRGK